MHFETPKTLNNYFDEIYCINLDSRPDRWSRVNARFQKLAINVRRFSAADGYSENLIREYESIHVKLKEKRKLQPYYLKNSRALGCLISGMQIIEDAKRNGYQKILLFDDDVIFHKNFKNLLNNLQDLPPWKLLYLGSSQHQWEEIEISEKCFYQAKNTHGTFAIGIDCSIYDEILLLYSEKEKNCDVYLMEIHNRYPYECLTLFPNLVIADVYDSTIRDRRNQNAHADGVKWDLADYEMGYGYFVRSILGIFSYKRISSDYHSWIKRINRIIKSKLPLFKIKR
jgi:GR25 family glycosyltransferase involved in LPS biosynthesis